MTDSDLFQLDPRLAATSIAVGRRAGIEVRLVNDSRYQWLMLVPCLPDIFEMDDLPPDVAADLFRLAGDLGSWLKSFAAADKINIAMIGNVVPQMHVHVVARHGGNVVPLDAKLDQRLAHRHRERLQLALLPLVEHGLVEVKCDERAPREQPGRA